MSTIAPSTNSSCLSGAFPVPLAEGFLCNPGFYCPNNTDAHPPEYCAPTTDCLLTRLQTVNNICPTPQGVYEPFVCPPGSFCAPGGQQLAPCPPGHFCPLGTAKPYACGATSICPAGSAREFVMDGFIFILVVDILLLGLFLEPVLRRAARGWARLLSAVSGKKLGSRDVEVGSERGDDGGGSGVSDAERSLRRFVASVGKCVGSGETGLAFGWEGLSLVLPTGKTILAAQSGFVGKGRMWAIMGGSGAGKSSFVNVLMGKTAHTTGTIYVNGEASQISRFKKLIGYVPQDDVLMAECTVRENIMHAASVRLPRAWTAAQRREHVDTLIACLGLAHVQHNLVGDALASAISGGQRKRVSIGLELAAAPMALFLDEPTSGLDASASLAIMGLLKQLSNLGVTVMCIIHQPRPEVLDFLDGLTLLHKGHQIYHGDMSGLMGHFSEMGFELSGKSNVADAVLDIISGHGIVPGTSAMPASALDSLLVSRWRPQALKIAADLSDREKHPAGHDLEALARSAASRGAPRLRQVYLCFIRSIKQQWIRKTSFLIEISVGAVAGLLIGLSLYQLKGMHFQGAYHAPFTILSSALNYTLVPQIGLLCSLAIGLAAAAPGVKTFGEEKQIYWREASSGHSRLAYYVGKVVATFPRLAISAMHFTTFYCVLATPWMPFWSMYLSNLLYFYCIYGLASIMSMLVRREDGPLMAMIVSLIIGVFGGYGPPLYLVKQWHLEWLWRLCPGIWLTEAYFDQHLAIMSHLYDLDLAASWTGYVRGRFAMDIGILLVIGTVYRVIAFGGLVFLNQAGRKR
ncbi:hypothetical protein C8A03DRAFT_15822 [Achaetomium macrosporum]|uniref:ABC transporter domain-containing protein n=1 Tax=Achaetomium macrosporum TaxID=79813 RepID=A0AAN7C905_9PEZI|nr:hypothetical protein C8A03DRAFT_15822 [Achaetomium macrosporum]